MSERTRHYIYAIVAAAGALALFYGLLTADSLPLWLALTAAVLGNGLAATNSSKGKGKHVDDSRGSQDAE